MIVKEWEIYNHYTSKPLIERLLAMRGVTKKDEVEEFLDPYKISLISPYAFCDMQKSVERIEKAIKNSEKIMIYGDFDADGITSTSLLLKTLRYLDANVNYFIPAREHDGHGLNTNALVKIMAKFNPKLFITVDCGISDTEETAFINSFKRDIIITDHHEAPETLPEAYAIINPKAKNSLDETLNVKELNYLSSLAGVGVAFKLAYALLEKYNKLEYVNELFPFTAVGTIADVVPLIGENRYFVVKGLEQISRGKHYGFKKLLSSAGYENIENGITSEQIAFGAAPRINASGRLESVDDAIKVLTSENHSEVDLSVLALNNFNKVRQELCNITFLEADETASKSKDNMLILYKKDWHIGIIGIAASKLVDKYGKPAFLMTYSDDTAQIRCSARGVEGCENINLYEIISNIADKLDGFGGHTLAAGLYFDPQKHSFEEIKAELLKSYESVVSTETLKPVLKIDSELEPADITENLLKDMARLEPFGAANPRPVFAVNGFKLVQKRLMGSNNEHLRLTVEKGGQNYTAIRWSLGDIELNAGDTLDIAFSPQLNTFNGNTTIQLIIKDIHSDCFTQKSKPEIITYDNRRKTDIAAKVNDYLKTSMLNFCVFAENHHLTEALKQYPEIYKRIVNRFNVKKSDGIMFFDYPPAQDIMSEVTEKVKPKRIHYMYYDLDKTQDIDYVKTLSGMIKYVCSAKDGIFNLGSSACFLGITTDMVEILLELFEDCGSIRITEREPEHFRILYIKPLSETKLKSSELFETFKNSLNETNKLRKYYLECDINELPPRG